MIVSYDINNNFLFIKRITLDNNSISFQPNNNLHDLAPLVQPVYHSLVIRVSLAPKHFNYVLIESEPRLSPAPRNVQQLQPALPLHYRHRRPAHIEFCDQLQTFQAKIQFHLSYHLLRDVIHYP